MKQEYLEARARVKSLYKNDIPLIWMVFEGDLRRAIVISRKRRAILFRSHPRKTEASAIRALNNALKKMDPWGLTGPEWKREKK